MHTWAQQPVLVTGANGFIGRRLVRRLIELRCCVTALVRAPLRVGWHTDAMQAAGVHLVAGDVTDRGSMERALAESQPATVFHLAGVLKSLRWGMHASDFARVNGGGVKTVAAACAARATPPVLVLVSSLAAVGPCAENQLRTECDLPAPVSRYGRSKLAGEQAAAAYAATVPTTIVRPPIVFGPGDGAVLAMFRPIARWGIHVAPGRSGKGKDGGWHGEPRFSLIHVDDLVEGLLLAAAKGDRLHEQGSTSQGVFFIAGDERPTYAQLGLASATALGQKPPVVLRMPRPLLRLLGLGGDVVGLVGRRPCWVNSDKAAEALAGSWTCSSARARTILGWSPATSFADRLRETAQWYRQAGWL